MGSVVTASRLGASARFGRRRGWALHHLWSLARYLGLFRRLEAVDWLRVRRLVFICRGNICRSAYAEQRAHAMDLPATSFGMQARDGCEADPMAIRVARSRGIDLRSHRARSLIALSPLPGDLLIAMEPGQLLSLMKLTRLQSAELTLLGLWCAPTRPHLQDPYGLGSDYFHTCFSSIDNAVENIRGRMSRVARPRAQTP